MAVPPSVVAEDEAADGPRDGRFESSGTPFWPPLVGSCSSSLLLPLMVPTTATTGRQGTMQSKRQYDPAKASREGVASVSVADVITLVGFKMMRADSSKREQARKFLAGPPNSGLFFSH